MNEHENRWRVYRATFDTNIFVRSFIRQENLANRLLSLWETGRFVLVLSHAIIDEVQEGFITFVKCVRQYRYTLDEVTNLINLLHQASVVEMNTLHLNYVEMLPIIHVP